MAKNNKVRRVFSAWGRGILVFCFSFFSVLAQAQSSHKLVALEFGYVEQPPRTFTNAQGKAEGQAIRLVSDLFAKAGLTWHPVSYPAARLFENLKDGTTAVSVLVRIPALDPHCLWSKVELGGEDIRVYSIGDRAPIKSREDLVGKSVIALRGYSYGNLLGFLTDEKNNITLSLAASNPDSFDMLLAGRADYLIQYAEASERILATKPIPGIRYSVIGRISRHLVISKAVPDAEKTMERLERILKTMDISEYMKSPRK